MNYRKSGAYARNARRPSRHCKLRVLPSDGEVARLERAVEASSAWSRGLLIAEAVRAGLANSELKVDSNRRLRRIDALVPRKLAVRLKEVAAANNVTQQHLLRKFLFQYLTAAPWERAESQVEGIVSCD